MAESIQIWAAPTERCDDAALRQAYIALLSDEEAARWRAFAFDRDRHVYLVARALARTVLGEALGMAPARIEFQQGPYGKPSLGGAAAGAGLRFNLSHTKGMVALALAQGRELGVDVEGVERRAALDIAWENFSRDEVRELSARQGRAQADRFWTLWTLKEAYLKALGCGLNAPLDCISFVDDHQGGLRYSRRDSGHADDGRWHFWHGMLSGTHAVSLCASAREGEKAPALTLRETVPLLAAREVPFLPALGPIREAGSAPV